MKHNITGLPVRIFFTVFILFRIFSCTPQGCLEETDVMVRGSFYQTGTGKIRTIDSITFTGVGVDTTRIYDKALNISSISIPLNSGSDTSVFIMKLNGIADTVTFICKSFPHFISKECGYVFFHSIENVTNTRTDVDFLISNRFTSTANEENIRIFL